MDRVIISNIAVYKVIADEAYEKMHHSIAAGRRSKTDGRPGFIITYDPNQTSFKQGMVSIVFTGMWLEALMHLLITKKYGAAKFKTYDFKSYREKLTLLGCSNTQILYRSERFVETRKQLVHEKAYLDSGNARALQDEAHNAHELLVAIHNFFRVAKT